MRLSTTGLAVEALTVLPPHWTRKLDRDFSPFAHHHQHAPPGDWTTWLVLGGRGAGKTRAGAEWVRTITRGPAPFSPIALIGETEHDAREVMVEGVSGLLAVHERGERPTWIPSRRRLEWRSGAVAQVFSAEDPESLRGPQFAAAWCDELAKWRHAEATFDMLQFGLRLGERPRQVITTTPRPIALIKRLMTDPKTALTRAATVENARHLAPAFLDVVVARYAGTKLGRQELDGDIVEERADALWTRGGLENCRVDAAPPLQRIVVAVDPPASASKGADACGLVAAGRAEDGTIYVIADETAAQLSPGGWSRKAIALWRRLSADALVVELSLVECPAFALTLLHALWIGHDTGINGFASLSALFMAYFGARFGVLGVYITGRTREKEASATGELPPTLIGELLKALASNKKK
jgi:phage terminase large subunit-like protein